MTSGISQACPFGYRILGPVSGTRRWVVAAAAFAGYARCDPKAECDREAYLSAFCFGDDIRPRFDGTGSVDTKGYNGLCWAPWVWWDIDRDGNLESALSDVRALATVIQERFRVCGDELLVFFSGHKGFHLGLSTTLWSPEPSQLFHRVTRRFAEAVADLASVTIDTAIYDKVRAFRAPNSRHPKSGLHKRRFALDELSSISVEQIMSVAKQPMPFELAVAAQHGKQAAADWIDATQHVDQTEAHIRRRAEAADASPHLNRLTLEFITEGAIEGERNRRLFAAAANLAEFGCPSQLAHALLTPAALDSGLPPAEVRRQILRGLEHCAKGNDCRG